MWLGENWEKEKKMERKIDDNNNTENSRIGSLTLHSVLHRESREL